MAATAHDLHAVVVAEMKTAGQVVRRHHLGVTAIASTLRGSDKTDSHRCTSPDVTQIICGNPLRDVEYRIGHDTNPTCLSGNLAPVTQSTV